jgi:hypothetical protein
LTPFPVTYKIAPRRPCRGRFRGRASGHERRHLDEALVAFTRAGDRCGFRGKTKDEIVAAYGD